MSTAVAIVPMAGIVAYAGGAERGARPLAIAALGIASGRVPAGGRPGDPVASWANPTFVFGGVPAVAALAYLAAAPDATLITVLVVVGLAAVVVVPGLVVLYVLDQRGLLPEEGS
ncbi:hypothetical protein [Jiangella sp. DSM 45060]|uniref:hypothetical protein n=1 Tax=Jiangella sp. DSM 45060 TaxID=1798224 RepID=UPI00087C1B91|nr:hypothetical protein [Jiangella sp. DSM 45060]SDT23626.1 hypothetical protein SAMN04515669_3205 [Jiangella sp. DSM 45060]